MYIRMKYTSSVMPASIVMRMDTATTLKTAAPTMSTVQLIGIVGSLRAGSVHGALARGPFHGQRGHGDARRVRGVRVELEIADVARIRALQGTGGVIEARLVAQRGAVGVEVDDQDTLVSGGEFLGQSQRDRGLAFLGKHTGDKDFLGRFVGCRKKNCLKQPVAKAV